MHQFARIILDVEAGDATLFSVMLSTSFRLSTGSAALLCFVYARLRARSAQHDTALRRRSINIKPHYSTLRKRKIILRDLKPHRQIRIKIIFPVHVAILLNLTLECCGCLHCFLDGFRIYNWQRTGVPHANRADCRVRRFPKRIVIAPTEHLGLRIHLCMDF